MMRKMIVAVLAAWAGLMAQGDWIVRAPETVRDWERPPKELTNSTALVQKAIDEAFKAGGGTVRLKRGTYLMRGIRLRSRVTLYLESGVVLVGSRDASDYDILRQDRVEPVDEAAEAAKVTWRPPKDSPQYERKAKSTAFLNDACAKWNNAMIRILNAHDVAIVGEEGSVIDGANSYDPTGEEGYRGVHGISGFDVTNLTFRGFTMRHTGNWAIRLQRCTDVLGERLTLLAGHDGFHTRGGERVRVRDCRIDTGDDGVAGYDNHDMVVSGCDISSACSAFRLGGRDILVEKCRIHGPCSYLFRGSLAKQAQRDGLWDPSYLPGRRSTATFFLYFCDLTQPLRYRPGNIVFRDCTVDNVSRFIRYNFGGETWQHGAPLENVRFENVTATNLWNPLALNASAEGGENVPLDFTMRNCSLGFRAPENLGRKLGEAFSCLNVGRLTLENVRVSGTDGAPLVRAWGKPPELVVKGLEGVEPRIAEGTGRYQCPMR